MRTFIGALRFEWIRLRSLRSTWLLALGALVASGLVAYVVAREIGRGEQTLADPEAVVSLLTGSAGVSPLALPALFAGFVGVLAFGTEYRHGLMPTAVAAVPRRGVLLLAKLVTVAAFAATLAVAAMLTAFAVARAELGSALSVSLLEVGATERALGGFVALVALTALLGVALGGLVRNAAGAAILLVALPAVIEPVAIWGLTGLGSGAAHDLAAHLPFTAGAQMVNLPGGDGPGFDLVALSAFAGGLTFLAFVAATTMASGAAFARRNA